MIQYEDHKQTCGSDNVRLTGTGYEKCGECGEVIE